MTEEVFDPDQCEACTPDGRSGCKLLAGHNGPHANQYKGVTWPNTGKGRCNSNLRDRPCLKDLDHTGDHQNGEDVWQ